MVLGCSRGWKEETSRKAFDTAPFLTLCRINEELVEARDDEEDDEFAWTRWEERGII